MRERLETVGVETVQADFEQGALAPQLDVLVHYIELQTGVFPADADGVVAVVDEACEAAGQGRNNDEFDTGTMVVLRVRENRLADVLVEDVVLHRG